MFSSRLPLATALVLSTVLLGSGCRMSAVGKNVSGVRDYQQGQYHSAIQRFQQALAADPNNADAYYNLAATYYALGKYQGDQGLMNQAEGLYHQCLDLEPNHVECHRGLAGLLVDTNRPESAFTLLKRWAMQNPSDPSARIELARLYEEFGDDDSAIQHLSDALHVDANDHRAWAALGRLREERGEHAQALSNYQQAYNLNQFQPGLSSRIATLQQSLNSGTGVSAGGTQMVTAPTPSAR
ncbi:MAG: tetratricopeptide repeat protein [Planctomycetota bacterium]